MTISPVHGESFNAAYGERSDWDMGAIDWIMGYVLGGMGLNVIG